MAKQRRCDYCFKRLKKDETETDHYYNGTCTRAKDDIKKGRANKGIENLSTQQRGLKVPGKAFKNDLPSFD